MLLMAVGQGSNRPNPQGQAQNGGRQPSSFRRKPESSFHSKRHGRTLSPRTWSEDQSGHLVPAADARVRPAHDV